MKKKSVFLILFLALCSANGIFATGRNHLPDLVSQIDVAVEQDRSTLWIYYQQARERSELVGLNPQILKQMQFLRDYLFSKIESAIALAKTQSKEHKKQLLADWQKYLEKADPIHQNCLKWYHTMDRLSYAYDFPIALTIAVWRKESSCSYYLPKNGDGPFQIVSKDYNGVVLNRESFEKMIQDFLLFSKHKIAWYNKKNPTTPIALSYQNLSQPDLLKYAALYNGLSGGIINGAILPAAPRYFWEKMPGEFEQGKRNGLFAQVLRILERELQKE